MSSEFTSIFLSLHFFSPYFAYHPSGIFARYGGACPNGTWAKQESVFSKKYVLQSPYDLDSRWPTLKVPVISGSFLQRKRKLVPCRSVTKKFRRIYILHLLTHCDKICLPLSWTIPNKITLGYLRFIASRKLSSYHQSIYRMHVCYRAHAIFTATTQLHCEVWVSCITPNNYCTNTFPVILFLLFTSYCSWKPSNCITTINVS